MMSRKDKLLEGFLCRPKDFSWDEFVSLLESFGYKELAPGKTGGSRRKFNCPGLPVIILHKPHPGKILKMYQLEQIERTLSEGGLISNEE
ncbi:MAG: type II toxin-antitoxin system HicA family toxin [Syntrophorhabdaceae bacterium]|nr:type II toxin-antitoxin system HicA family toxin [Syntrophorhabdaceae bacterium]